MATHVVGLDIGLDTLRAVEMRDADKAKPAVVRCHEVSLPSGAVSSGEVHEVHTVAAELKRLWAAGGFRTKKVALGIGNQRVLVRDLTVPRNSLAQIRESLPFHVQDLLPVPVAEALLDFYPIAEATVDGNRVVQGLLVAATKDTVMANVNAVREAGLIPARVDLIPFALSRIMSRGATASGTTAIVDVGATTTQVVVATNGVPTFVRIIPSGGHDITAALAKRLGIDDGSAEEIKRTRGLNTAMSSEDDRPVIETLHGTTGELLVSLRNTLNYVANTRENESFERILLTGGGAALVGFPEALAEITRLPVTVANPFGTLDVSRIPASVRQAASMTIAAGLALGSAA